MVDYTFATYKFPPPGPAFDASDDEKFAWPGLLANAINLANYPVNHEVLFREFKITSNIYNGENIHVLFTFTNDATGDLLFDHEIVIPNPSTAGWDYWTWYKVKAWIGHADWEIFGPMTVRIAVRVTSDVFPTIINSSGVIITDSSIPPPPPPPEPPVPPPSDLPDFWDDPLGWFGGVITGGFVSFLEWFVTYFLSWTVDIGEWLVGFSAEAMLFLEDPIGRITIWVNNLLKSLEQETATTLMDLRADTSDHWRYGTEWQAGQYKTIDDLTYSEFRALVDKGLTDDADALRAADFRVYKLDASSRATFESTMAVLRAEVGGLWLGIDEKAEKIIGWDSDQYSYIVNWIETTDTSLPDQIGDILDAAFRFVDGGFLNFEAWELQNNLDTKGYMDSEIINVKDWVNLEIPSLVSGMFDWIQPIIQPIIDAAGWLGSLVGIVTETVPEPPEITEHKEKMRELRERLKEIMEGL